MLHIFLPACAKALCFIGENGNFIDEASRARMVYLLQYLATGVEHAPMDELVLSKILCGIAPGAALASGIELSSAEKEEGEHMVMSAIAHWNNLRNISIEGLREAFLVRDGIIVITEGTMKLYMEQRAQDILLKNVPWNFSIIKTPWMQQILQVSW